MSESEVDPEFLKQLQEAFVIEAREQLQTIMTNVINMEGSTDEADKLTQAESILHELHSMKGNSRAAGITTAETVCQLMEGAIFSMRRKKELLKPEAADVFHKAIDTLDDLINKVEAGHGDYLPVDFADTLHKMKMLDERQRLRMEAAAANTEQLTAAHRTTAELDLVLPTGSPSTGAGDSGASAGAGAAAPGTGAAGGTASAELGAGSASASTGVGASGASTGAGAAAAGTSVGAAETASAGAADAVTVPAQAIQATGSKPTGGDAASSAPIPGDASKPQAARTQGSDKSGASTRIALWKLDKLLRESEEMLILKQVSEQHLDDLRDLKTIAKTLTAETLRISNTIKDSKAKNDEQGAERNLNIAYEILVQISATLEQTLNTKMRRQNTEQRLCFNMVDGFIDSVKSLLMQDFSSLLSIVPKVVRDLARELHKDIDLEIFGTEIEIDRRILEEIKDPVIHLVRNSLDHGIETSEARLAAGKPAKASLRIGARQDESGYVQLIISDDGRGINAEKLKAAAIKEGAISAEEAASMSEAEAIDLMYRSSVSTSEKLTEISGRGLGMAIVKERLHELGGRVIVETKLGKGTTFILQLPTKLSTFRGIQVMVGKHSFIIPTLHVHYAGRVSRSEIRQSGNRNVTTINNQLTSVQSLSDVLKIDAENEFKSRAARNYQQILVLESGDRRAGFLVDEILHEHEVLVRGLSYPLVRVPNISGATILGSGQVVPVLNTADLLESSNKALWADEKLRNDLAHDIKRAKRITEQPVFLVDKHSTSQIMLKCLLESEGYLVQTFDSNETALEGLDFDEPLVLLKNNELPETQESGLAFWVRKDLRLKDLPIVFFGAHPQAEGLALSQKLGGNAYFSKLDFDRKQILEMIERLT